MVIDPKSSTPIYRQIVEQISDAIDAGVYRPGETLPSLRALAVEIRVNPNTVQRAYDELEREGIVHSRRGLGVFVSERKEIAARSRGEKSAAAAFRRGISTALESGITPARIRAVFESTLSVGLAKVRKQP
jgi:DNA-binding transcriptional regulator YhcF (GntR family)